MRSAYNEVSLHNLMVVKEAKRWWKHNLITGEQYQAIQAAYPSSFFHPNFIIRILLFIATLFALGGVTGVFFLSVGDIGETGISIASIIYSVASFLLLKYVFIDKNQYKSGVTEALLYHSVSFMIGGLGGLTDFDYPHFMFLVCLLVFSFAAYRYLDLICTICAVGTLAGWIFFGCYEADGVARQVIPFVFIIVFGATYFIVNSLKKKNNSEPWLNNLILVEALSLLLVYAAGNYLVVRELSINMMGLVLEEGQDIPIWYIFFILTVLMPVGYLYFGIKNKDIVLIRVSLVVIAFTVFTFKYYYGFGHPEITLTIAGFVLAAISYSLFRYLKVLRNGFARENLLSEKWSGMNVEAFVVSQTMGGNQVTADDQFKGGGGEFGGAGSSGNW